MCPVKKSHLKCPICYDLGQFVLTNFAHLFSQKASAEDELVSSSNMLIHLRVKKLGFSIENLGLKLRRSKTNARS